MCTEANSQRAALRPPQQKCVAGQMFKNTYKCNQMDHQLYTPTLSIIPGAVNANGSPPSLQSPAQWWRQPAAALQLLQERIFTTRRLLAPRLVMCHYSMIAKNVRQTEGGGWGVGGGV